MYNILLDKYPTEYQGYLIRSDYRIGMQITTVLENPDMDDEDRMLSALVLLYGYGMPNDMTLALNGLKWFLSCGRKCAEKSQYSLIDCEDIDEELEESVSQHGKIAYDFELDSDLIYGSMLDKYGVRIDRERMHWFEFMAMFRCLKDTQLNDMMYYRTVDVMKLPKSQRTDMRRLQDKYRVRKVTATRKAELMACFGTEWKEHI